MFNQLQNAVDEITGKPAGSESGDHFTLEKDDFDRTESALTEGEFEDVAEYVVPAQTMYDVGYGSSQHEATVGRWYASFDDGNGNTVSGIVRVETRNARDKNVDTEISGVSTSRLDSDPSDYRTQYAVPQVTDTPPVGEDSKVVIKFKLKSGSTGTSIDWSADATDFELDLTEF